MFYRSLNLKNKSRFALLCLLTAIVFSAGCSHTIPYINPDYRQMPVLPDDSEIIQSIFLLGDTGYPQMEDTEPNFKMLMMQAVKNAQRNLIVLTGDNIYPAGLPPEGDTDRAEALRRLDAQLEIARSTGVQLVFVPGNHDWGNYGSESFTRRKIEQKYINDLSDENIHYVPADSCPGPQIYDTPQVRLIVIDSQWWLHDWKGDDHGKPECSTADRNAFTYALQDALESAGDRFTILVAHHPLATYGEHGGFFTLKDHLFPLTNFIPWLYLPLPVIGSAYPLYRQAGFVVQDLSAPAYKDMIYMIRKSFKNRRPDVVASGHDHALQILADQGWINLVSGAGTEQIVTQVSSGDNSIFAHAHEGFMRIDLLRSGKAFLSVWEPGDNSEQPVFIQP